MATPTVKDVLLDIFQKKLRVQELQRELDILKSEIELQEAQMYSTFVSEAVYTAREARESIKAGKGASPPEGSKES